MTISTAWKIIFIDDEEDIRQITKITLEDAGYDVVTARNGENGLRLCDEISPQIVITDIRMPGIDGLEVLEALKNRHPDIEVIVATAFGEMDLAIRALQLDASDFITKPINIETLHLALKRAKDRYTSRKQLADYTSLLEKENANQASILHQDKMMSLGRLAASVVHEINNPLSGILNYLRLMTRILKRGPLQENHREKFQEYLDLVEKETSRCSNIISNLLTFSRKSEPSFDQVNIDELLARCLILSQHKLDMNNIDLVHSVNPGIPPVLGDFNQLQQCIINLIFNAIDAMTDGGTLTLEGGYDAVDDRVTIIVKDSGTGISQENLSHIFEPFFTTKDEGYGVGLGLSTVFGIIERHNGTVSADSKPGKGAVFKIQLPGSIAEIQ